MVTVTPLYAGLLTLLFLALSYRVVAARRMYKVSVGDGGERVVLKRMRAQANCAEYAPLGILLLALAELQGMPHWLAHLFGSLLLLGRLSHAYGFSHQPQIVPLRKLGMYLTLIMLVAIAMANIGHAVF